MKTTKKLATLFTFGARCYECGECVEEFCSEHPKAEIMTTQEPVECASCSRRATEHDADGDPACREHAAKVHVAGCDDLPFDGGKDQFVVLMPVEARNRLGLDSLQNLDSFGDVLLCDDGEVEELTKAEVLEKILGGDLVFAFDRGSKGSDPDAPGKFSAWHVWLSND